MDRFTLSPNQKIVIKWIKEWSLNNSGACFLQSIKDNLEGKLSETKIALAIRSLIKKGYLRANSRGNRLSYTLLRWE